MLGWWTRGLAGQDSHDTERPFPVDLQGGWGNDWGWRGNEGFKCITVRVWPNLVSLICMCFTTKQTHWVLYFQNGSINMKTATIEKIWKTTIKWRNQASRLLLIPCHPISHHLQHSSIPYPGIVYTVFLNNHPLSRNFQHGTSCLASLNLIILVPFLSFLGDAGQENEKLWDAVGIWLQHINMVPCVFLWTQTC